MTIEDNSPENSQGVPTPSRNKLPPLKNVRVSACKMSNDDTNKLSNNRQSLGKHRIDTIKVTEMSNLRVANPEKERSSVNFLRMQQPEYEETENEESEPEERRPRVRHSLQSNTLRSGQQDWAPSPCNALDVPERASSISVNTPRKSLLKLPRRVSSNGLKTPHKQPLKMRSITSPMSPNTPGILHDSRLPPSSPKLRFKFESDRLAKRPEKPTENDLRVVICYRGGYSEGKFTEKWIKVPKKGLYKFDVVSLIDPAANQTKIVMENAAWIVLSRVSTTTKLLYLRLWSCITAILFFLPMDRKKNKYPEVNIHIPLKGMSKADFCTLIQPQEDPDNLVVEGWDKTFTSLETFDVYSVEWIVRDERVVMLSRRPIKAPKTQKKRVETNTKKFHQLRSAFTKRIRRTSL